MLTFDQARQLVLKEIEAGQYEVKNDRLIIIDEATIEKPYVWIFFYTSKRYFETNDIAFAIAGNGPKFVDKLSGKISCYFTSFSVEECIETYEEENKIWKIEIQNGFNLTNENALRLKANLELKNEELLKIIKQKRLVFDTGGWKRLNKLKMEFGSVGIETKIEIQNPRYQSPVLPI